MMEPILLEYIRNFDGEIVGELYMTEAASKIAMDKLSKYYHPDHVRTMIYAHYDVWYIGPDRVELAYGEEIIIEPSYYILEPKTESIEQLPLNAVPIPLPFENKEDIVFMKWRDKP